MEASSQEDTEPRASASGYLKVRQLVSDAAAKTAEIHLLTRAALFAYMPSCVPYPLPESQFLLITRTKFS
jgi:hypothetical protein